MRIIIAYISRVLHRYKILSHSYSARSLAEISEWHYYPQFKSQKTQISCDQPKVT